MSRRILGERVFTADEAAVEFHVPATTIRQYAREGRIRGRKIGKAWHFTESALRELVQPQHDFQNENQFANIQEAPQTLPRSEPEEWAAVSSGGVTEKPGSVVVGGGVVEGVRVSVQAAGNTLRIELDSDKASLINQVMRHSHIKVEEAPGQFLEVDPTETGILRRDGNRWIYRITVESDQASLRSVTIAGRLIHLAASS